LDAHNSEEYFPTGLRPWGGNLTYVPQFSVRMVSTPSTKEELSGPSPNVVVKLSM